MAEKKRPNIAIFDFDDTLVYSDTLLIFLGALIGSIKSKALLVYSVMIGILILGFKRFSKQHDFRTDIKKRWLRLALKDLDIKHIKPAIEVLIRDTKWKEEIVSILAKHAKQQDKIVIATGALDIYIIDLLNALKEKIGINFQYAHIICTKAEIQSNKLTGNLFGDNTVRTAKKDLVQTYMNKTPHFESYGYGNAPNDLPFLEICTHKMII